MKLMLAASSGSYVVVTAGSYWCQYIINLLELLCTVQPVNIEINNSSLIKYL